MGAETECVQQTVYTAMLHHYLWPPPISLDGVAVHPDCWCVCLCYVHFAPENPEDGEMYPLVPAHLGYPRQSPKSHKMIVCVCVYLWPPLS